jgi:hypothetical protein
MTIYTYRLMYSFVVKHTIQYMYMYHCITLVPPVPIDEMGEWSLVAIVL